MSTFFTFMIFTRFFRMFTSERRDFRGLTDDGSEFRCDAWVFLSLKPFRTVPTFLETNDLDVL